MPSSKEQINESKNASNAQNKYDDNDTYYIIVEEEVEVGDEEEPCRVNKEKWANKAFADKTARMSFTRKVFFTLTLMLTFCVALSVLPFFVSEVGTFIKRQWYLVFLAFIVEITIIILVGCCNVGKGPIGPVNVTIAIIFTVALSYICASTIVFEGHTFELVVIALAATAIIFLLMLIVTLFVKRLDITGCGLYLFIISISFILFAIVAILLFSIFDSNKHEIRFLNLVISFAGAMLCSIYLLYNLQLVIGGRKYELGTDMWLYTSISLFSNIVNLFLCILGIGSLANN